MCATPNKEWAGGPKICTCMCEHVQKIVYPPTLPLKGVDHIKDGLSVNGMSKHSLVFASTSLVDMVFKITSQSIV